MTMIKIMQMVINNYKMRLSMIGRIREIYESIIGRGG